MAGPPLLQRHNAGGGAGGGFTGLLAGVFDGHGPNGGYVSGTISQNLLRMVANSPQFQGGNPNPNPLTLTP